LEKTIIAELRDVEFGSSNPGSNLTRDSLGITYGSPREGTRQLRDYVHRLSRRISLTFRGSLQFSDSDSCFKSAEHSPQCRHFKGPQDQEVDVGHDHYDYSLRSHDSPASFNRDRYGLDESPQLAQAVGAQAMIGPSLLSQFVQRSSPERQISPEETVQGRYLSSLGRPASAYGNVMVREQGLAASHYDGSLVDEADISLDGVHGAFL
jgi:hypothetical protein